MILHHNIFFSQNFAENIWSTIDSILFIIIGLVEWFFFHFHIHFVSQNLHYLHLSINKCKSKGIFLCFLSTYLNTAKLHLELLDPALHLGHGRSAAAHRVLIRLCQPGLQLSQLTLQGTLSLQGHVTVVMEIDPFIARPLSLSIPPICFINDMLFKSMIVKDNNVIWFSIVHDLFLTGTRLGLRGCIDFKLTTSLAVLGVCRAL